MAIFSLLLALGMASDVGGIPSCDAPMLGVKGALRPVPGVVFDSIVLSSRPRVSVADLQAVRDSRVDLGLRCAIYVIAHLGGLRASELKTTSEICAPLGPGSDEAPRRSWPGYDQISVCTLYLTRDRETGRLRHASLWIVATGGKIEENGSRLQSQYEIRLERPTGSQSWTVVSYAVRNPE